MSKIEIENVIRVWAPEGSRFEIDQDPDGPGVRLQFIESDGKVPGEMFFNPEEARAVGNSLIKIANEFTASEDADKLRKLMGREPIIGR